MHTATLSTFYLNLSSMNPSLKKGVLAALTCVYMILFSFSPAAAQDGTISGTLTDAGTKKSLPFAFISILKKDSVVRNTMTDANGAFRINVPAGTYSVKADHPGYKSGRTDVVIISAGKTAALNLAIYPENKTLSLGNVEEKQDKTKNSQGTSGGGKKNEMEKQGPILNAPKPDVNLLMVDPSPPPTQKDVTIVTKKVEVLQQKIVTHELKKQSSYSSTSNGSVSNNNVQLYNKVQVGSYKQNQSVVNKQGYYNLPKEKESIQPLDPSQTGKLTAGEINDFSKWKMWNDIEATKLKTNQEIWKFYPSAGRYTVQVTNQNNGPVVDCPVKLNDASGKTVWSARTDNTGKAELWSNMYDANATDKDNMTIIATYKGKEHKKKNAKSFYNGINSIEIPADCNVSNKVEVAFVTDATGSMQDEINFLKTDMNDIIGKIKGRFPELEITTAGMFYRCVGNSYVTKRSDFTKDVNVTSDFIKSNNAGEGGDEALEIAMDEAVNMLSWSKEARARIIFLVLDEPPGKSAAVIEKLQKAIAQAAEKGIRVIPIVCSGEGYDSAKNLEYLTRCFALATNGTYVFLTDHSGIGNAHTAPETDKYKVETLNEIMVRLLYQYTKVPSCKEEVITTVQDTAFTTLNDTLTIQMKVPADTSAKTTNTNLKPAPGLKYYPNPCAGPLCIEPEGEVKEIFLADINGKLVKRWVVTEKVSKLEVDLSEFSNGIYYIQIPNKDKWVTGKVVLLR
jgi:hypothetical protein